MKEIFVLVVGIGWLLFIISAVADVLLGFDAFLHGRKIGSRILSRWRDVLWTFRYRGDPVTVYFYKSSQLKEPFRARIYSRIADDLVFEVMNIPGLGVCGRLSVALGSYGTEWCWGHEGEEVEALAVARALT